MEQNTHVQKRLESVDRNFEAQILSNSIQWLQINPDSPILLGLMTDASARFCRMPLSVAEKINPQVAQLYANTSGGRLHFVTDSHTLAVRMELGQSLICSHMAYLGVAGADVYTKEADSWMFAGSLIPTDSSVSAFEAFISFTSGKTHEVLLYLPLYAEVKSIQLGIEVGCTVLPLAAYNKKVVFYGSSITQGGCAPRPGVSYPAILSRRLGFEFVNLGFSAGAHAEKEMLDYLCSLPMDVLVFDYDHNAPEAEYLEQTHLSAYRIIRALRPELLILLASAPLAILSPEWMRRREIVQKTYQYAKKHGDFRVDYVDGVDMYPSTLRGECSVDGIHPNALGMCCMADAFEPPLRRLLSQTFNSTD